MPVSRKKRNKKNQTVLVLERKERHDLEMEALRLEGMRNRRSMGNAYDYLTSSLITQSLSNMRARRKVKQGGLII